MEEINQYRRCLLCPRACGVNRAAGNRGFCGETAELRLAAASIHRGEEPPITGGGGSGTIFVSGCNLGCTFCQNYQISERNHISENSVSLKNRGSGGGGEDAAGMGRPVDAEEFARICLVLQEQGAENINIVTGSHAVPALARGIDAACAAGLGLPVLWNSSAYESPEALELLRGRIDGYMPDLKTLDSALAARFFHAPAYPDHAAAAIRRMMEYRPGGVIIRHLILPGHLDSTREVLRWFAENARGKARISLMSQYTPVRGNNEGGDMPERPVGQEEYETVLRWLEEFGIDEGFYQELVTGSDWLPDFSRLNPFPSDLSVPVWHWSNGFL